MNHDEPIQATAKELEIMGRTENTDQLREAIIERVRELIHSDFQKLVNILYRMDVSETKLKRMLEENPDSDAGVIITELIIERQAQKIAIRKAQGGNFPKDNIPEEDKW